MFALVTFKNTLCLHVSKKRLAGKCSADSKICVSEARVIQIKSQRVRILCELDGEFVTTSWKQMLRTKTEDLNCVQETGKSSKKPKSKAHGPSEMSSTMIGRLLERGQWNFCSEN
jgi:hypothetical protein